MDAETRNQALDILDATPAGFDQDVLDALDSIWDGKTVLFLYRATGGPDEVGTRYKMGVCSKHGVEPTLSGWTDSVKEAWEDCQAEAAKRRWKVKPRKGMNLGSLNRAAHKLHQRLAKLETLQRGVDVSMRFGVPTLNEYHPVTIGLRDSGTVTWHVTGKGDTIQDAVANTHQTIKYEQEDEARRIAVWEKETEEFEKATAPFKNIQPGDKIDFKSLGIATICDVEHIAADPEACYSRAKLCIHVVVPGNIKRNIKVTSQQGVNYLGIREVIRQTALQRKINLLKVRAQDYLEKKGFRKFGPASGHFSVGLKGYRVTLAVEPDKQARAREMVSHFGLGFPQFPPWADEMHSGFLDPPYGGRWHR